MPCNIRSKDEENDDVICKPEAVLKKLYIDFTNTPTASSIDNVSKPKDILRISSGNIQDIFKEIDKPTSSDAIKNKMKNILLQESNCLLC
jgi:hypothetical protein